MTPSRYIEYTTRLGDTFDRLALQAYNDEKMAGEDTVSLRIPIFENAAQPETLAPWRRGA